MTTQHVIACLFCFSAYPAIAMQPPKKVICQKYVKATQAPVYTQNICTQGKGVITPIQKLSMSVMDVMVIDTAASL